MKRDPDCIFCKIVAVEIPSDVVYEDDTIISFIDINPLSEGHLLVVPRDHVAQISELTQQQGAALGRMLPVLGKALRQVTGADGFNVLINEGAVAGQEVGHVHYHLIPRSAGDGLGYRWNAGSYAEGRAKELAGSYQAAVRELKPQ